ncbi:transmembrane protein 39A isoform X2 [Hyalella azteca]|uniref:Transmembrane protein 39A isoform X2 n=1 Tax=Hyalella azteca TaxID=294128 RepID=A0A8B7PFX5_HYAAZ|nr:transmembrane protein 39A isoform X2 [Hyalella azteca]
MPGGRRSAYLRSAATRQATDAECKKTYDDGCSAAAAIRHPPLPDIPRLSVFAFESLMCLLSLLVLGGHYLNIYRTVFWLPHSHTRYVVNLYLIEPRVVIFIVVSVSRRLVWCVVKSLITSCLHHTLWRTAVPIARAVVVMVLATVMVYCLSTITDALTYIKVVALVYPFVLYFFIFDLELTSFLELIPVVQPSKDQECGGRLVQHSCLNSSEGARHEAELLSSHCYRRLTQVVYQTLVTVYYTTLIPCFFVPNTLHYDAGWLTLHTLFVVLTCFVWHLIYCFPARFCDVVHRSVQHLGHWRRVSPVCTTSAPLWQSSAVYGAGAVVQYGRQVYRAEAAANSAEPGNSAHARLHGVFDKVYVVILNMLLLCFVSCMAYVMYLCSLYQWQQILATSVILAAHFGALYILLRDYIVLRALYKQES